MIAGPPPGPPERTWTCGGRRRSPTRQAADGRGCLRLPIPRRSPARSRRRAHAGEEEHVAWDATLAPLRLTGPRGAGALDRTSRHPRALFLPLHSALRTGGGGGVRAWPPAGRVVVGHRQGAGGAGARGEPPGGPRAPSGLNRDQCVASRHELSGLRHRGVLGAVAAGGAVRLRALMLAGQRAQSPTNIGDGVLCGGGATRWCPRHDVRFSTHVAQGRALPSGPARRPRRDRRERGRPTPVERGEGSCRGDRRGPRRGLRRRSRPSVAPLGETCGATATRPASRASRSTSSQAPEAGQTGG